MTIKSYRNRLGNIVFYSRLKTNRNCNHVTGYAYTRKFPKNSKYGTSLILGIEYARNQRINPNINRVSKRKKRFLASTASSK